MQCRAREERTVQHLLCNGASQPKEKSDEPMQSSTHIGQQGPYAAPFSYSIQNFKSLILHQALIARVERSGFASPVNLERSTQAKSEAKVQDLLQTIV